MMLRETYPQEWLDTCEHIVSTADVTLMVGTAVSRNEFTTLLTTYQSKSGQICLLDCDLDEWISSPIGCIGITKLNDLPTNASRSCRRRVGRSRRDPA